MKKIEYIKIIVKYEDIEIADESTYWGKSADRVWKKIKSFFGLAH